MVEAQLNVFDAVVLLIVFLSTVLAFFRGFVREVLSLGSWIGAAIITIYFFPQVSAALKPRFSSEVIAGGFAMLGTYIVALIVLSILSSIILKYLKEGSEVGIFDNMLGMVFGFARGAFIVSLGFLLISMVMSPPEYPDWIKHAQTREYVEEGAKLLASAAPNYLNDLTSLSDKMRDQASQAADNARNATGSIQAPSASDVRAAGEQGYKWMNVESLQRMIESNVPNQPSTGVPNQ